MYKEALNARMEIVEGETDIRKKRTILVRIIKEAAEIATPRKVPRKGDEAWLNADIKRVRRERKSKKEYADGKKRMGGKEHRAPKIDQRSKIQDMERQPGENRQREKHRGRLKDGERIERWTWGGGRVDSIRGKKVHQW